MRGNRGSAVAEFFSRLSEGDPVALGMAGGFLFILLLFALLGLYFHFKHKREDEEWAKRRARKWGSKK